MNLGSLGGMSKAYLTQTASARGVADWQGGKLSWSSREMTEKVAAAALASSACGVPSGIPYAFALFVLAPFPDAKSLSLTSVFLSLLYPLANWHQIPTGSLIFKGCSIQVGCRRLLGIVASRQLLPL